MLLGYSIIDILYMLPVILFSVAIHEYSHAMTAFKLGDRSQLIKGRLTLDPFAHIDLFGILSMVLVLFGWGKPVSVDDTNFKNKRKDNMIVALAGPISNLAIALLFTLILKVLLITNLIDYVHLNSVTTIFYNMFLMSISLNILLAVFNMLPFVPFDGSKVLSYFIPYKHRGILVFLEKYSFYIVMILIITGAINFILFPFINGIEHILNIILAL